MWTQRAAPCFKFLSRKKIAASIDLNDFLISLNGLDLIHIHILGQLPERRPTAFLLTFCVARAFTVAVFTN